MNGSSWYNRRGSKPGGRRRGTEEQAESWSWSRRRSEMGRRRRRRGSKMETGRRRLERERVLGQQTKADVGLRWIQRQ